MGLLVPCRLWKPLANVMIPTTVCVLAVLTLSSFDHQEHVSKFVFPSQMLYLYYASSTKSARGLQHSTRSPGTCKLISSLKSTELSKTSHIPS